MNTVTKVQKRAARSILDKTIDTPSEELFTELKWMTFPERNTYQKAILMYKIMHNLTPPYLSYLSSRKFSSFPKKSMIEPLDLHQKIFCMFLNQTSNFTETVLHIQDLSNGTPFQTISGVQPLFNISGLDIGTG